MQQDQLHTLIGSYLEGIASPVEVALLDSWYHAFESRPDLISQDDAGLPDAINHGFAELKVRLGIM